MKKLVGSVLVLLVMFGFWAFYQLWNTIKQLEAELNPSSAGELVKGFNCTMLFGVLAGVALLLVVIFWPSSKSQCDQTPTQATRR